MFLKRLSILSVLFFCTAGIVAATEPAATDKPVTSQDGVRIYEVQKGDTLWGISRKFIDDPYYWPDLWANNPEIRNPHFIFPKQQIKIYSGPIMVVETEPEQPAPEAEAQPVVAEPVAETPKAEVAAEPVVLIPVPVGVGYVTPREVSGLGEIYDFHDARKMAAAGDSVFVRMKSGNQAKVGDRFSLMTILEEIRHPVTRRTAGYQIIEIGALEITAVYADVSEARIISSYREIERGTLLTAYNAPRLTVALKKSTSALRGVVLSSFTTKTQQGQNDVIYLDLGSKKGLAVGNLVDLMRPRQVTDEVKASTRVKNNTKLPDQPLGQALVVEVNEETATAVILKALSEIQVGDIVLTPTAK